ncbi:MAG: acyl carrier protein [Acetobacteraceae bacterium]|jgi:acyl carrier protein|nr:acyl carrier protein [Acetobacteraceae bacterium]
MSVMTREDVFAQLQGVFRDVFDDEAIVLRPNTTAADIPGWDSLNQIKIIISCERALGVRLKPREINALENVDEMVDHLMATLRASKRA